MVPEGLLFIHVFCHREKTYPFDTTGSDNWMGRFFFTGGMMPSYDYIPSHRDNLTTKNSWWTNGTHYRRTARAWRLKLESRKLTIVNIFEDVYGAEASVWYHRWRLFFLACEEMFGYNRGLEWGIGHYLLAPKNTSQSL